MKKFIKIFSLIIFIIFVLGITTSYASTTQGVSYELNDEVFQFGMENTSLSNWYSSPYKVTSSTSAVDMLEALKSNNLTGISNSVRDNNENLICRERSWYLASIGQYELVSTEAIEYPGTDSNGYAKAYILAAPGYVKSDSNTSTITTADERQYAWYIINGEIDNTPTTPLYDLATAYQNYKEGEKTTTVTNSNAQVTVGGDDIIYGPITITYSYAKASSGTKSDEWGGFNYAFFDSYGNNVTGDVTLCTLSNETYKPIESSKITSSDSTNGYYSVRTSTYNGISLYVVVPSDKNISSLTIKIQENTVDYKAKVYPIRGEYWKDDGWVFCADCREKVSNAIDLSEFNASTTVGQFVFVELNGTYYEYTGYTTKTVFSTTAKSDIFNLDGTAYSVKDWGVASSATSKKAFYCDICNLTFESLFAAKNATHIDTHVSVITKGNITYYGCSVCGGLWTSLDEAEGHIQTTHIAIGVLCTYKIYNFKTFTGCGQGFAQKVSSCGTYLRAGYYHSQGLYIIEDTSTTTSNEIKLEVEIPLSTSIEVTKVWDDFSNFYNVRPASITLNVYRSTNGTNWTLLTKGTDYTETWKDNGNNTWTGSIDGLERADANGNLYYFKVEEASLNYYTISYGSNIIDKNVSDKKLTITNTLKYVDIPITKTWGDCSDTFGFRPTTIKFNVFRSVDGTTWTKLTENTDYVVNWSNQTGDTWKATIAQLLGVDEKGNEYYFKVEEQAQVYYEASYPNGQVVRYDGNSTSEQITISNSLEKINLSGYVWLDGQTGIKPAVTYNGIMNDGEERLANIVVYLYHQDPTTRTSRKIAETVTDENGHYEFNDYEIGYYYVEFEYDGINYENTISVENGSSKAFEEDANRDTFNDRFETITYKQSNDGTVLDYEYSDRTSTLITNEKNSTKVKSEFIMNAATEETFYSDDVEDLNLGLVKRGMDIALSTDVYDANVTINGQTTDYTYNKEDNSIEIGTTQTVEEVSYNLYLYSSDYEYRVRDYVNTQDFSQKDYLNDGDPGINTGDDLEVYVTYELNLQNQSTVNIRINEVQYIFDEKYSFVGLTGSTYNTRSYRQCNNN